MKRAVAEAKARDKAAAWTEEYKASVTQLDGFGMTCGQCGRTGNFDDFTHDSFGHERDRASYQCPFCRYAFRRVMTPAGLINLEPVQPTL